jgi:excisionase family DNA binding protein
MEEFFTVQQVAVALNIHQLTIRRYIKEGKLKAVRAGGNIRISRENLHEFTQSFVPRSKATKEFPRALHGNFSFNDPLFRLKGRGLGIDIGTKSNK